VPHSFELHQLQTSGGFSECAGRAKWMLPISIYFLHLRAVY